MEDWGLKELGEGDKLVTPGDVELRPLETGEIWEAAEAARSFLTRI